MLLVGNVTHFAALLPAAVVALGRDRSATYVLVAAAFAVSFLADLGVLLTGHSWSVLAIYPVLQFGLFAVAFGGAGLAILLCVVALLQAIGMPGPDMLVTGIGSIGVLYLATPHRLHASMLWYCGVASVCWLLMVPVRSNPDAFMLAWWPYQAARLIAFGLFVRAAWKPTR